MYVYVVLNRLHPGCYWPFMITFPTSSHSRPLISDVQKASKSIRKQSTGENGRGGGIKRIWGRRKITCWREGARAWKDDKEEKENDKNVKSKHWKVRDYECDRFNRHRTRHSTLTTHKEYRRRNTVGNPDHFNQLLTDVWGDQWQKFVPQSRELKQTTVALSE
jgi:hypothetical protein